MSWFRLVFPLFFVSCASVEVDTRPSGDTPTTSASIVRPEMARTPAAYLARVRKNAVPGAERIGLARDHLRRGMPGDALRELDALLAESPRNLEALRARAWVLQHDQVGRRFGPGWQRAESIATYRRLLDLDPTQREARADLAAVLETSEEGRPFGAPIADLSLAVEEYQRLLPASWPSLTLLLLRLGRYPEVEALLKGERVDRYEGSVRVTLAALTQGPNEAVGLAQTLRGGREAANAVLTAAQLAEARREYATATFLFAKALNGTSQAEEIVDRIRFLSEIKRIEEHTPRPTDSTYLLYRVLRATYVEPLAQMDGMATAMLGDPSVLARLQNQRRRAVLKGLPAEEMVDALLSPAAIQQDGNSKMGWRFKLNAAPWTPRGGLTFYVMPRSGAYRLYDDASEFLGAEALMQLDAGEPERARWLLDWAYDQLQRDEARPSYFQKRWPSNRSAPVEVIQLSAAQLALSSPNEDVALRAADLIIGRFQGLVPTSALLPEERLLCRALARRGRVPALRQRLEQLRALSSDDVHVLSLVMAKVEEDPEQRLEILRARNRDYPNDAVAIERIVDALVAAARLGEAQATLARDVELHPKSAQSWSRLAWVMLLQGTSDDVAVEAARKGVELAPDALKAPLLALAAVYAERGQPYEARQALLQSLLWAYRDGRPEFSGAELYLQGRIAEGYGQLGTARDAYERALDSLREHPATEGLDPALLIRRRLDSLAHP